MPWALLANSATDADNADNADHAIRAEQADYASKVRAIREIGDSNDWDKTPTAVPYTLTLSRYVLEAPEPADNNHPDSIKVNEEILVELCADEDGCTVMLGMRNWDPAYKGLLATRTPERLSLSEVKDEKRSWRHSWWDNTGANSGVDGDGSKDSIMQARDCWLQDYKHVHGDEQADTEIGLWLINWYGWANSPDMVCVLIIDD